MPLALFHFVKSNLSACSPRAILTRSAINFVNRVVFATTRIPGLSRSGCGAFKFGLNGGCRRGLLSPISWSNWRSVSPNVLGLAMGDAGITRFVKRERLYLNQMVGVNILDLSTLLVHQKTPKTMFQELFLNVVGVMFVSTLALVALEVLRGRFRVQKFLRLVFLPRLLRWQRHQLGLNSIVRHHC